MKRGGKRDFAIALGIVLIFVLANTGFFSFITGEVVRIADTYSTPLPFNVSLEITSNNLPQIIYVSVPGTMPPIEEGGPLRQVIVNFTVYDLDGGGDIDISHANVTFYYDDDFRVNDSCLNTSADVSTNGNKWVNFSCSIGIYYFDAPEPWTVTVYAVDSTDAVAVNATQTFTPDELPAIRLSPSSISFGGLIAGSNDSLAQSPTLLNNTGNANFTLITINASNLSREGYTDFIGVGNFSVNGTWAGDPYDSCNGTVLVENDATQVPADGGTLSLIRGNLSEGGGEGQTMIYYCLDVPVGLPKGSYNSTRAWELELA
ncbi:hypothetical protein ACFLZZ_02705 [Nanoarchaeota archaeon]